MKKSIFLIFSLFSSFLWAEQTTNLGSGGEQLSATEILMLNRVAYPSLGMDVVSLDDEGLVMRSKDSRYYVKGVVSDLWDGVSEPLKPLNDIPSIPDVLDPSDYSMAFGEGDTFIRLFLTPSCKGCMVSLDTLSFFFDPFKHRIELVWLFNNGEDKKTVEFLLCRSPSFADIGKVIAESLDALEAPCYDPRLVIGHTLAKQQKVYALPYYTTKDGHTINSITSNPFK